MDIIYLLDIELNTFDTLAEFPAGGVGAELARPALQPALLGPAVPGVARAAPGV